MSNAYATARIGSASTKKLSKVKNKLAERELELFEARKQIKLMQEIQRRQEKALGVYTDSEADLPRTLRKKDEEIRTLSSRAQRLKLKAKDLDATVKKKEKIVRTLTSKKEALEQIVNDKGLKEREVLRKELAGAEEKLRERDAMVSRLERMLELANKERNRKAVKVKKSEDPGTISRLQREMAGLRAQLDAARASRPAATPSPKKNPLPGISVTQPAMSPPKALSPTASPSPGWQAAGIPSNVASPEPNLEAQAALAAQQEAAEASRKAVEEAAAQTAAAEAAEKASRQAAAAAEAAARAAAAEAERAAVEAAAEAERQAANAETERKKAEADRKKKVLLAKLSQMDNRTSMEAGKPAVAAAPPAATTVPAPVSSADGVIDEVITSPPSDDDNDDDDDDIPSWLSSGPKKEKKAASANNPTAAKTAKPDASLSWLTGDSGAATSTSPAPTGGRRANRGATRGAASPALGGPLAAAPAASSDAAFLPSIGTPRSSAGASRGVREAAPSATVPAATAAMTPNSKRRMTFSRDQVTLPQIGTPPTSGTPTRAGQPAGGPRPPPGGGPMSTGGRAGRRGRGANAAGGGSLPGMLRPRRGKPKKLPHASKVGAAPVSIVNDIEDVETIAI